MRSCSSFPSMQVRDPSPDVHMDSRSSKKMRRTDRQRETTRIGGQSRSCNLWGATPPVRPARGDLGSQNTGGREILGFAPPSPVEQQGSLTEPPGRPLVAFHRADLNNRPRPKAVVLSRPPEGVFCVWLPPLGAWNRSGLSFLTPLSIGFSGDHESSAFLYHRRPSQSWYRLRMKHARSLEALRVTRPEAVDSVSIEQRVSISSVCFVPRPALRVACAPGVASAQRSGSDPVRLTTRLQGSAEEPIGLHASLR